MPDDRYYIVFKADGYPNVKVLFGEGSSKVTDGYGNWDVVARERRVGITTWTGRNPFRVTIPILFDGYLAGQSREDDIQALTQMALPVGKFTEPPTISIHSTDGKWPVGVPKPDNTGPTRWKIETLEWGDNVIWGVTGRLRQDCSVHLLAFVDADRLALKDIKLGTKADPASKIAPYGWKQTYTRKGEKTLEEVAKHVYGKDFKVGDGIKWLKPANPTIRDPRNLSKVKTIKIPKKHK